MNTIKYLECILDHFKNLINFSILYNLPGHIPKISWKFNHNLFNYPASKRTDGQTSVKTVPRQTWWTQLTIITARRYASAVYAVTVCLSVRLSQVGILPKKRLNVGSRNQRRTINRPSLRILVFCHQRFWWNSNGVTTNWGTKYMWGRLESAIFLFSFTTTSQSSQGLST